MANKPTTTNNDGNATSGAVFAVPEAALSAIDVQIQDAGGLYTEPVAYKGSVARTMFDTPAAEDGTVTVLIPKENMEALANQSLVRVKSVHDNRIYLGAVVRGPFAE